MPLPYALARALIKRTYEDQHHLTWLRPDQKSQVTVEYKDGVPVRVTDVVLALSHDDMVDVADVRAYGSNVIKEVLTEYGFGDSDPCIYINSTGLFVIHGPQGDIGVSGRKLVVNTFGGYYRNGGGAILNKDATKADMSAPLLARYIALHVVESGLAEDCEVQLSFAIGHPYPVSISVDCFDTNHVPTEDIEKLCQDLFKWTPADTIKNFHLAESGENRVSIEDLAMNGIFGRPGLPWETKDEALIAEFRKLLK